MKAAVLAMAVCVPCVAQYQLPPGTSSSVPAEERRQALSPEAAVLQRAEEAIAANHFEEAVGLLAPLAVAAQKNERVFYDLGFAQDALGHDAEAAAAYKAAVALDAGDAAAQASLGLLLARGGDHGGAEEHLSIAAHLPGADAARGHAYRALAQIHVVSKTEQARDELLAGLKLSPETPEDAALAAEIADALGDDAGAAAAYARALGMSPGDAALAVGYARVLARDKKFAEAETVLAAARTAHPGNRQLAAELALEALLQGHSEQALPLLTQLHMEEPGNTPVSLLLARAYADAGLGDKADALYAALLAASPDDPVLLAEAGDALIRAKRSPEAEPLLQRAMVHRAGFPNRKALADAAGELAFAAQANHDAATTLEALTIRESIVPLTAPFTFLRASAHDTLRHTREAVSAYRRFLQQAAGSFPDQEWQAQQRLKLLERAK